jgi:multiple sugar transport system substrate-binding protein
VSDAREAADRQPTHQRDTRRAGGEANQQQHSVSDAREAADRQPTHQRDTRRAGGEANLGRPRRRGRARLAVLSAAAVALLASACTAGGGSTAGVDSYDGKPVTITFWHQFTDDDHEVKAVNAVLADFHAKYPNITVTAVKAQGDDQINNAIRGGTVPDVAMSFTANNAASWCSSGAFQDLGGYLDRDKVDVNQFPKAVQSYVFYKGKKCFLPWESDAYGLYYNKKLFAAAGISAPPKTMSELAEDARKLTKRDASGAIQVAGYVPVQGRYEEVQEHLAPSFGAKWLKSDGTSNVADPAFAAMLTWEKSLYEAFGDAPLQKFNSGLGDEFSPQNGFQTGKVAMAVDGEYRTAFIKSQAPSLDYGTAPMPVADDHPELYGAGYITGNLIGIPRGAKHAGAAWELIKYLTTDAGAVAKLAAAINNVPSTVPALSATPQASDPHFKTFLDVFANPNSDTTPSSVAAAAWIHNLDTFAEKYLTGKTPDLQAALADQQKQDNDALKLGQ